MFFFFFVCIVWQSDSKNIYIYYRKLYHSDTKLYYNFCPSSVYVYFLSLSQAMWSYCRLDPQFIYGNRCLNRGSAIILCLSICNVHNRRHKTSKPNSGGKIQKRGRGGKNRVVTAGFEILNVFRSGDRKRGERKISW